MTFLLRVYSFLHLFHKDFNDCKLVSVSSILVSLKSAQFLYLFKVLQFLYLLKVPTKAAGGGWGSESPSDDRHLPDYHFQSYIASIFAILHFYSFISCIKITSAMHEHVLGFKPSADSLKADHEDEEGGNHEDNT